MRFVSNLLLTLTLCAPCAFADTAPSYNILPSLGWALDQVIDPTSIGTVTGVDVTWTSLPSCGALGTDAAGNVYCASGSLASTYLKLDASNDPLTGTLDTQHVLPSATATYDLGFSDDLGTEFGYRTLYLDNNGGIVLHVPLADALGVPTNYTQFLGGGGSASEGGTYTMQFYGEQILGGAGNNFVIDYGARPAIGSSLSTFKLISAIGGSVGTIDLTVPISTPLGTAETGFYLNNGGLLLVGYGLVFDNKAPQGDNTELEFRFNGTNAFSMDMDDGAPSARDAFAKLQQPAAITNSVATYSLFDIDDTNTMNINGARTSRFQLRVQAPNITIVSGSLTNSAALYLDGPATEATNNYTIWDDIGFSRFDGGIDLDSNGVRIREDGDGQLELTGLGDGADECLALNLDDTANTAVFSNCATSTGVTNVALSGVGLALDNAQNITWGGSNTLTFNGSTADFEFSNDINITDVEPHLSFIDSTANHDDFHLYADGSRFYLTNLTDLREIFSFSDGASGTHARSMDALLTRTAGMTCGGTLSTSMDCEDFKTRIPSNCTVQRVDLQVSQAPTTQAIIVDVNECDANGANCTTIDSSTKPQIAAGATSGSDTAFTDTVLAQGGFLQCDVDQVGSGTAGADLTVTVTCLL